MSGRLDSGCTRVAVLPPQPLRRRLPDLLQGHRARPEPQAGAAPAAERPAGQPLEPQGPRPGGRRHARVEGPVRRGRPVRRRSRGAPREGPGRPAARLLARRPAREGRAGGGAGGPARAAQLRRRAGAPEPIPRSTGGASRRWAATARARDAPASCATSSGWSASTTSACGSRAGSCARTGAGSCRRRPCCCRAERFLGALEAAAANGVLAGDPVE